MFLHIHQELIGYDMARKATSEAMKQAGQSSGDIILSVMILLYRHSG